MSANRILDVSASPARLSTRDNQLVVELDSLTPTTIPLVDLAAVIIAHAQIRITSGALSQMANAGCSVVVCDRANRPVGMYLPLASHSRQVPRFRAQSMASLPLCKRLWRELVRAKIRGQAAALQSIRAHDHGLQSLVALVRSGDPANVEARAARRYWRALFGESFRRDHDGEDANRYLNYGYAVARAIVARAICAAGLHPTLGIHHHHQDNAYCLADDLLEPFRPLVDRAAVEIASRRGATAPLDAALKREILLALTGRVLVNGEQRTVFEAAERLAVSLADVFLGKRTTLELPESLEPIPF
jgi:CRISPR-associated protein Cas1